LLPVEIWDAVTKRLFGEIETLLSVANVCNPVVGVQITAVSATADAGFCCALPAARMPVEVTTASRIWPFKAPPEVDQLRKNVTEAQKALAAVIVESSRAMTGRERGGANTFFMGK